MQLIEEIKNDRPDNRHRRQKRKKKKRMRVRWTKTDVFLFWSIYDVLSKKPWMEPFAMEAFYPCIKYGIWWTPPFVKLSSKSTAHFRMYYYVSMMSYRVRQLKVHFLWSSRITYVWLHIWLVFWRLRNDVGPPNFLMF